MLPLRYLVPFIGALLTLSACGGGNIASTPSAGTVLGTSAVAGATAASNTAIAIPASGALSAGTITLPAVTSGSGASLSVKTSVGSAVTSSLGRRSAQSVTNATAFAQVTMTANAPVTFTGVFVAAITYAGGPATYDGTFEDESGDLTGIGASAPSGSTYTLSSPSNTYVLTTGQSVSFSFSTAATFGSGTPPPTLPGPIVLTPASLSFLTTGSAAAQTVAVSESNFTGAFTATSENMAIATASIRGGTITVTPVGPGTTSIDVAGGLTAKISITVTTSPVTVQ